MSTVLSEQKSNKSPVSYASMDRLAHLRGLNVAQRAAVEYGVSHIANAADADISGPLLVIGGRTRSPGVAQRPTGGRLSGARNRTGLCPPSAFRIKRLLNKLSRLSPNRDVIIVDQN
jgi:hypothetical protein